MNDGFYGGDLDAELGEQVVDARSQRLKPFAATIKLHNNFLREPRIALGLSGPQMAERIGVSYHHYIELENLRTAPFNKKGEWRPIALQIAEFHRTLPEDIFSAEICGVQKNTGELKLSVGDMTALAGGVMSSFTLAAESPEKLLMVKNQVHAMDDALNTLAPNLRKVLTLRFGLAGEDEHSTKETANALGVSISRVGELEARAIRTLRDKRDLLGVVTDEDQEERITVLRERQRAEALRRHEAEIEALAAKYKADKERQQRRMLAFRLAALPTWQIWWRPSLCCGVEEHVWIQRRARHLHEEPAGSPSGDFRITVSEVVISFAGTREVPPSDTYYNVLCSGCGWVFEHARPDARSIWDQYLQKFSSRTEEVWAPLVRDATAWWEHPPAEREEVPR